MMFYINWTKIKIKEWLDDVTKHPDNFWLPIVITYAIIIAILSEPVPVIEPDKPTIEERVHAWIKGFINSES